MDLETLNKEYVQFKSDLEKARKEIESLESKANDLADDKIIWKGKLVEAKRNKDYVAEKQAEGELKRIDTEIKAVQDDTLKKKEEMELIQAKINVRIKEIKENPEMKKHLDEVMSKKYDRKLSKLENEKEEAVEKKDRLTDLKQLVTDHPALGNNLKGILTATKEMKDLQAELDGMKMIVGTGKTSAYTYKDPARANEIINTLLPQAQAKLATNKTPLMAYISKNGLNITEQDIDELAEKGFAVDGKGNIDLNSTMNKSISSLNRQIKGYDKSIRNHQIALENIDNRSVPVTPRTPDPITPPAPDPITPPEPTTSEKPKWYQFIQRFKNWNERRKQQALPEPEPRTPDPEPAPVDPEPSTPEPSSEKNEFLNSLKYEIVQDVVKQMETDNLKEAKKERKSEDMER